ncbi:MAG: hypothetical protein JXR10_08495 [Cyclobacteriaceae bacterium]
MLSKLYSVIDVETTGGQPSLSKITDISIFVTDGYEVLDEFSSLVNPKMAIPEFITQLTGIDDDMVSDAPTFEEIAKRIIEVTENTTFVAHNVNFDFGMISGEFKRLGYDYQRDKLCTVRLARKYLPGHRSYSLGNICEALQIPIKGRHRARGDAEATVELFNVIMNASDGRPTTQNDKWVKCLPAHIDRSQIDDLPIGPGVLYLKNEVGEVLEISAAENVQQAAIKLLQSTSKRNKEIKSTLHTIVAEAYGWGLIAQLKAMSEKQKLTSSKPKRAIKLPTYGLSFRYDLFGYVNLSVEKLKTNYTDQCRFHSLKEGKAYLESICSKHKLCDSLSGLELKSGCKNLTCKGACRQIETPQAYNERVRSALNNTSQSQRSYALIQKDPHEDRRHIVLIENDELAGTIQFSADEVIQSKDQIMDLLVPEASTSEKMKVVEKYLEKHRRKVQVLEFD